jgi:bifunctional ADP-heptose synthase (sugar kinase/adenylyltransferase)
VLKTARSEELFDLIDPEKQDKYFYGEVKWLIEELIDMKEVFGVKEKNLNEILSRLDKFLAN